jgi:cell division protein FtsL
MSMDKGYGARPVYGTLAYDLSGAAVYPDEAMYPPARRKIVIPAPPEIKERVTPRTAVKPRQSIAPLSIVGFICAAVLIVFCLMAKIQLTAVTDEAVRYEQQLTELEVAQNRLLIDYERAFNLTEIEEYASTQLGMQRPRDEQIYYIDSFVPDKAVIISGSGEKGGLTDRVFDFLSSIAEYLR